MSWRIMAAGTAAIHESSSVTYRINEKAYEETFGYKVGRKVITNRLLRKCIIISFNLGSKIEYQAGKSRVSPNLKLYWVILMITHI